MEHEGRFRAAGDDRLCTFGDQGLSEGGHALPDLGSQVAALDPRQQVHEAGLVVPGKGNQPHALGGDVLVVEPEGVAGSQHARPAGTRVAGHPAGGLDHVHQGKARGPADQVCVDVGGVAGDGQDLGASALETAGHLRQDRPGLGEGIVSVGHLGIDVHDDPDVVLVLVRRRQGLELAQEVQGCGRPHAAKDAENLAHSRCPSRTDV